MPSTLIPWEASKLQSVMPTGPSPTTTTSAASAEDNRLSLFPRIEIICAAMRTVRPAAARVFGQALRASRRSGAQHDEGERGRFVARIAPGMARALLDNSITVLELDGYPIVKLQHDLAVDHAGIVHGWRGVHAGIIH